MLLQDGTYIRGEVHSGNGESIRFRVEDASVKSLKGEREIPTASISTVVYRERLNGSMAAAIFGGGLSGIFLGAIGGLVTSDAANEGPRAAGGGIAGGLAGTVTGLALAERNWKEITLIVK